MYLLLNMQNDKHLVAYYDLTKPFVNCTTKEYSKAELELLYLENKNECFNFAVEANKVYKSDDVMELSLPSLVKERRYGFDDIENLFEKKFYDKAMQAYCMDDTPLINSRFTPFNGALSLERNDGETISIAKIGTEGVKLSDKDIYSGLEGDKENLLGNYNYSNISNKDFVLACTNSLLVYLVTMKQIFTIKSYVVSAISKVIYKNDYFPSIPIVNKTDCSYWIKYPIKATVNKIYEVLQTLDLTSNLEKQLENTDLAKEVQRELISQIENFNGDGLDLTWREPALIVDLWLFEIVYKLNNGVGDIYLGSTETSECEFSIERRGF